MDKRRGTKKRVPIMVAYIGLTGVVFTGLIALFGPIIQNRLNSSSHNTPPSSEPSLGDARHSLQRTAEDVAEGSMLYSVWLQRNSFLGRSIAHPTVPQGWLTGTSTWHKAVATYAASDSFSVANVTKILNSGESDPPNEPEKTALMAMVAFEAGKPGAGEAFAQSADQSAGKKIQPFLYLAASLANMQSHPRVAKDYAAKAASVIKEPSATVKLIDAYEALADMLVNPSDATIGTVRSSIDMFRKDPGVDRDSYNEMSYYIGEALLYSGQPSPSRMVLKEAERIAKESLAAARDTQRAFPLARANDMLGNVEYEIGGAEGPKSKYLTSAAEHLFEAFSGFSALSRDNPDIRCVTTFTAYGFALLHAGNWQEFEKQSFKYLEPLKHTKDLIEKGSIVEGNLMSLQSKYERTKDPSLKGLQKSYDCNEEALRVFSASEMGKPYVAGATFVRNRLKEDIAKARKAQLQKH